MVQSQETKFVMAGFSVERIVFLSLVLDLFGAFTTHFGCVDIPYSSWVLDSIYHPSAFVSTDN